MGNVPLTYTHPISTIDDALRNALPHAYHGNSFESLVLAVPLLFVVAHLIEALSRGDVRTFATYLVTTGCILVLGSTLRFINAVPSYSKKIALLL